MDYSCEQKIILCGKSGCPLWWPTGPLAVALDAASTGPNPWLEIQITTHGESMAVAAL